MRRCLRTSAPYCLRSPRRWCSRRSSSCRNTYSADEHDAATALLIQSGRCPPGEVTRARKIGVWFGRTATGRTLGLSAPNRGRRELELPAREIAAAKALCYAWQPQFWRSEEAARVALLLAVHRGDEAFTLRLEQLLRDRRAMRRAALLPRLVTSLPIPASGALPAIATACYPATFANQPRITDDYAAQLLTDNC